MLAGIFWLLIALTTALLLLSQFGLLIADTAIALILVALAIHRLEYELKQRGLSLKFETKLKQLYHWFASQHNTVRNIKTKHELRLHRLDVKKTKLDEKIEQNYRDLARKIIELENRINKLQKAFK